MFTLLVILALIMLCMICAVQYQVTNDYKPYRVWNDFDATHYYVCMRWQYSIFSLKDYINKKGI